MAIEAWMYGNPETVAIRREEAALLARHADELLGELKVRVP